MHLFNWKLAMSISSLHLTYSLFSLFAGVGYLIVLDTGSFSALHSSTFT